MVATDARDDVRAPPYPTHTKGGAPHQNGGIGLAGPIGVVPLPPGRSHLRDWLLDL